MRNCEMCGTKIPDGEYVCPHCGGIVSDDDGDFRIIGNPEWGRISVFLNFFSGNKDDLFEKIKLHWRNLEGKSAQRLFSGQMDRDFTAEPTLVLYGPRESFLSLLNVLVSLGVDKSLINFDILSYDEIYKIRDGV